jgi:methylamine---glutamate N-methyltransferase subunit A
MCGIVGLYLKDDALQPELGRRLTPMLIEMTDRGPDSAGVAIYRNGAPQGWSKLTLFHPGPAYDWAGLEEGLANALDTRCQGLRRASHFVLTTAAPAEAARRWIGEHDADVRVMSVGESIEIYKEKGLPKEVAARFELETISGSHAIGHTRMATESAVTTEHSHPFSTGRDLCLVHNGSLSNHNRLRAWLRRRGIEFQTDNDSEVAAGYLTYRLGQGASLEQALEAAVKDLDGFFTFAVGTRDGFAVVRDPIACKHAVLAETDQWVAMATEYRAIAKLPGSEEAHIWEPVPGEIYSWERSAERH